MESTSSDKMKKTIEGELFHEIEEYGDKKYAHIGFRDKENKFGKMIESMVPEIGMTKKATLEITIEGNEKDE